MKSTLRETGKVNRTTIVALAVTFSVLFPASIISAQLNRVVLNIYGNMSSNEITAQPSNWKSQEFSQHYALQALGYVINPQILNFNVASTFRDQRTVQIISAQRHENSVRNLEYYTLSGRLLGSSRIPLSFRAQRSAVANYVLSTSDDNWLQLSKSPRETMGLSWRLPSTAMTPNVSMNFDRSRSFQGTNTTRTDNYNLLVHSTSVDGQSNYSASVNQIGSTKTDAQHNQSTSSQRQLSFQTSSLLHDRLNVGTRLNNTTTGNNTQSLGILSFDLRPSRQLRHHLELHYETGSSESKYNSRQDATIRVTERSNYYWIGGNRVDFGMSAESKQLVTNLESLEHQSGELFGNGQFNTILNRYRLTTTANARAGYSNQFGSSRMKGQTGVNLSLATQQFQRLQITLLGGANYNRMLSGSESYGTKMGLRTTTSLIPLIYLSTDLSRQDVLSGKGALLSRNYNIQNKATTRVGRTLQVELENIQRWYDSSGKVLLASSITRLRLVESGLIRDAFFMLTAQQIHHQYNPDDDVLISASAQYKFFAYFIKLRYNFQGGVNRQVFLEFARQISIL